MPRHTAMRALVATFFALCAVPAFAQSSEPASPTSDDCMTCHADPATTRADGTPLVVDAKAYAASVHGQIDLACVDCHADLAKAELPHAEKLAPVDCSTCHADAVTEFKKSVHAKARAAGNTVAASCVDCHGMHDIRPAKDPESRVSHFNLATTCGKCHGDDAVIARAHLPGGNVVHEFEDSIHGRALTKGGLVVAPSCASCHGAHAIVASDAPESRVARANIPGTCGTCHEGISQAFSRGKHGAQLQQDNPSGPVCIDCHSAHHIQRAEMAAWKVDVVRECGTCHDESIASYRDTFHGQVTNLGYTRVATCADCHGAHEVLPASDPRSPISAANRLATCQKCHPGANANFAKYDPHANRHRRESGALLYYTGHFMDLLLLGVFGFFGIHTSLWFVRSWREVRARRGAGKSRTEARKTKGDQSGHA